MLRSRQDGANVLAIRPCDAGYPALVAVLKPLDVILLVRNHESQTQLTLTPVYLYDPMRPHNGVKAP